MPERVADKVPKELLLIPFQAGVPLCIGRVFGEMPIPVRGAVQPPHRAPLAERPFCRIHTLPGLIPRQGVPDPQGTTFVAPSIHQLPGELRSSCRR